MTLAAGTRLGPYEILSPIGAGGMGEVYRALDTRLERQVAVKILPERTAQDSDARQRFEREARAIAALSHPAIVSREFGIPAVVGTRVATQVIRTGQRVRPGDYTPPPPLVRPTVREKQFKKAMEYEVAFVKAGGLLIAGLDPTGNGGIVAGFGDLRQVELLVEAGFTPVDAIKIASFNGAKFLGEDARIGSIAAGKQADLMVVKGNPAANINDIEKVEIVFKDGVGYDTEKLIQSVQGLVGIR